MNTNYAVLSTEANPIQSSTAASSEVACLDEKTLLAAAREGHAAAFDALWQSHATRILRITFRITRNREDAEDALQDALLMAFVHIGSFDGRSSFSTWLTRIAFNSALMIVRKRRSALELSIDDLLSRDARMEFPAFALGPEAHFAQRERAEILLGAIRTLPPANRQALELRQLQEHSMDETAEKMGLTVAAAKSRVLRAKAELRKSRVLQSIQHLPIRGEVRSSSAA